MPPPELLRDDSTADPSLRVREALTSSIVLECNRAAERTFGRAGEAVLTGMRADGSRFPMELTGTRVSVAGAPLSRGGDET